MPSAGGPDEPYRPSRPHRQIWAIAGPAMLAGSTSPLVGLVDTAIIGHLPSALHLAAVGIGATFFNIIFWSLGFLRMGTTGLVAQAHGSGHQTRLAVEFVRAFAFACTVGIGLVLAGPVLVPLGLGILNSPADVTPLADRYISIRLFSVPLVLISLASTGYLIGRGRTSQVLALSLLLNGVNLIFNLLFVLGFGMGVAGLALGSLVAETLAGLAALCLIFRDLGVAPVLIAAHTHTTWAIEGLKRLLSVNGFIFVRTIMLLIAFSALTRKAAEIGATELAGAQILLTFSMLISLGLDGIAHAAEALTGQAKGAQNRRAFRFWVIQSSLWAGFAAFLYSVAFWFWGTNLVHLLTNIEDVRQVLAPTHLLVAVMPLVAVASYQFDGIYIGATASRAMAGTMAISFAGFMVVVDPLTDRFGISGLWGAILVLLALRGITQLVWYPRLERQI